MYPIRASGFLQHHRRLAWAPRTLPLLPLAWVSQFPLSPPSRGPLHRPPKWKRHTAMPGHRIDPGQETSQDHEDAAARKRAVSSTPAASGVTKQPGSSGRCWLTAMERGQRGKRGAGYGYTRGSLPGGWETEINHAREREKDAEIRECRFDGYQLSGFFGNILVKLSSRFTDDANNPNGTATRSTHCGP